MIILRRYQRCDIDGERYLFLATVRSVPVGGKEVVFVERHEVSRVRETKRGVVSEIVVAMSPELQAAAFKFAGVLPEDGE